MHTYHIMHVMQLENGKDPVSVCPVETLVRVRGPCLHAGLTEQGYDSLTTLHPAKRLTHSTHYILLNGHEVSCLFLLVGLVYLLTTKGKGRTWMHVLYVEQSLQVKSRRGRSRIHNSIDYRKQYVCKMIPILSNASRQASIRFSIRNPMLRKSKGSRSILA